MLNDFKITKCKYCGENIICLPREDKKGYKERTVCDNCAKPKTKKVNCKYCGKQIILHRQEDGKFPRKEVCDDCLAPAKSKILTCQKCGKTFEVHRTDLYKQFPNLKYCDECSKPTQTKEMICEKCGRKFIVYKSTNSKQSQFLRRRFCDDCSKPITEISLICQKCGKEYKVNRCKSGYFSYSRKYCDDCIKPETITKNCKVCGKEFTVFKHDSWKKTCSKECAGKLISKSTKETCQAKYGVDYPCLLPQVINSNPNIISKLNLKFAKKLKENNIPYKHEFRIGSDYSYDFQILNTNILIELNPTISHTTYNTGVFPQKEKQYHLQKTQTANEKGYRCINVWDWDNWDKIIDNIKPKQKLYARKLQIKEITKQEANQFLDTYHLQNSCYGNSVNLGLYQGEELIQIMTFGKPRYNPHYQWELLRLCTHSNYYVVGGAERLFKHFVKTQNPDSVLSYCDFSKFTGDVYTRLGFKQTTKPQPRKHWNKHKSTEHITSALLLQKGYDNIFGTNYGKGTDNEQLMIEHNWLPIYDCGQINFVWQKENN